MYITDIESSLILYFELDYQKFLLHHCIGPLKDLTSFVVVFFSLSTLLKSLIWYRKLKLKYTFKENIKFY